LKQPLLADSRLLYFAIEELWMEWHTQMTMCGRQFSMILVGQQFNYATVDTNQ